MIEVQNVHSKTQLNQVFNIRREVFVKEQMVDENEEYDEFEFLSSHLLAYLDKIPVGTCRYRNTQKGIKLERFAVLKDYRKYKVGEALVRRVLSVVDLNQHIYLHAQVQVVDFYQKYGFEVVGNIFEEANIQHYKMIYCK